MAHPQTNITEEGEPGDLSAAATDEFGGTSDETVTERDGAGEIAADDPGSGGLAGSTGRTAGGDVALGVGSQAAPTVADDDVGGAAEIAADDAGAGARLAQANGSGAD